MVTIDSWMDPVDCTISCGTTEGDALLHVVLHFFIYLIVDILLFALSLVVYAIRFTKLTHGQTTDDISFISKPEYHPMSNPKISYEQVVKTMKVLWHSFELHLNRYMVLFYNCFLIIITYVLFSLVINVTINPRWIKSSSSSSSSSL